MSFVFLTIGWFIGIFVSSFFLVQPMIILFFALPTILKMKRQGILNNTSRIVLSHLMSLVILVTLFVSSVFVIDNFFPKLIVGFWIGAVIIFLLGLPKLGKSHNMSEFIENNMRNIDLSFLVSYLESVKANHPDTKGKIDHVSKLSSYVVESLEKLLENDKEIKNQDKSDSLKEVVAITMRLFKEELEEHWTETMVELSSEWDLANIEEQLIKKEVFIALITLDLFSSSDVFDLFGEDIAPTIRRHVINYLSDMYGNEEPIETVVNDIYYPAAMRAFEVFIGVEDRFFNSVICSRLKQPASSEVILIISKLYGHMTGKWSHFILAMNEAKEAKDTA